VAHKKTTQKVVNVSTFFNDYCCTAGATSFFSSGFLQHLGNFFYAVSSANTSSAS
jgi:hypothetical protein